MFAGFLVVFSCWRSIVIGVVITSPHVPHGAAHGRRARCATSKEASPCRRTQSSVLPLSVPVGSTGGPLFVLHHSGEYLERLGMPSPVAHLGDGAAALSRRREAALRRATCDRLVHRAVGSLHPAVLSSMSALFLAVCVCLCVGGVAPCMTQAPRPRPFYSVLDPVPRFFPVLPPRGVGHPQRLFPGRAPSLLRVPSLVFPPLRHCVADAVMRIWRSEGAPKRAAG